MLKLSSIPVMLASFLSITLASEEDMRTFNEVRKTLKQSLTPSHYTQNLPEFSAYKNQTDELLATLEKITQHLNTAATPQRLDEPLSAHAHKSPINTDDGTDHLLSGHTAGTAEADNFIRAKIKEAQDFLPQPFGNPSNAEGIKKARAIYDILSSASNEPFLRNIPKRHLTKLKGDIEQAEQQIREQGKVEKAPGNTTVPASLSEQKETAHKALGPEPKEPAGPKSTSVAALTEKERLKNIEHLVPWLKYIEIFHACGAQPVVNLFYGASQPGHDDEALIRDYWNYHFHSQNNSVTAKEYLAKAEELASKPGIKDSKIIQGRMPKLKDLIDKLGITINDLEHAKELKEDLRNFHGLQYDIHNVDKLKQDIERKFNNYRQRGVYQ